MQDRDRTEAQEARALAEAAGPGISPRSWYCFACSGPLGAFLRFGSEGEQRDHQAREHGVYEAGDNPEEDALIKSALSRLGARRLSREHEVAEHCFVPNHGADCVCPYCQKNARYHGYALVSGKYVREVR